MRLGLIRDAVIFGVHDEGGHDGLAWELLN
jgi:hypothetical protein